MKLMSVVGARPQFVKLAPFDRAVAELGHEHFIVHTGQHYDRKMSDVFFDELKIPAPDVNLGVGSSSHGAQTASMLAGIETVLLEERPDWLVVYGDTNSTLAATLAAVKIHTRVAHIEAGLRSFNRSMPEEHNRVLTDHAADLLLAPTQVAYNHLDREGLADRTRLVGDVMVDVFTMAQQVLAKAPLERSSLTPGVTGDFFLSTIHRQESTDDPDRLRAIIGGLAGLDKPVVLAAHPRLRSRAEEFGIDLEQGAISLREPFTYLEMVAALDASTAVITDSGGLQKEAFLTGRPCTTIRTETEWVETLVGDWNVLVEDLVELDSVVARAMPIAERETPYGTGHAGTAAVEAIASAS